MRDVYDSVLSSDEERGSDVTTCLRESIEVEVFAV
jgi:hypothetical protein